ncbi:unnamed protein product [Prorocentrum cordatum]|uniref:beta-glucosidase n=1 Tax=Prorocentrum cordatum TaxID=2364126 RepID=A0ABN9WV48_9DINO|nr:unnamed protein product [Polarella glacialis]
MAVAKGFAFAGQERGKSSMDAAVDSQTAWEDVHYPPFVAAVDAGVSAIMCAGNKVDGDYACENANLLKRDLKEAMGFEGFVMSSWLGTRSAEAIDAGLDMEMPTARWFTEEHLLGGDDGDHSMSVNEDLFAAVRVVASIYHARLHEQRQCEAPCGAERRSNQRGSQGFAHMDVALDAARKSIVLLKNDGGEIGHSAAPLRGDRHHSRARVGGGRSRREELRPGQPLRREGRRRVQPRRVPRAAHAADVGEGPRADQRDEGVALRRV